MRLIYRVSVEGHIHLALSGVDADRYAIAVDGFARGSSATQH